MSIVILIGGAEVKDTERHYVTIRRFGDAWIHCDDHIIDDTDFVEIVEQTACLLFYEKLGSMSDAEEPEDGNSQYMYTFSCCIALMSVLLIITHNFH